MEIPYFDFHNVALSLGPIFVTRHIHFVFLKVADEVGAT